MQYKFLKSIEKGKDSVPLGTTFYFTDKWFTLSSWFQVKMEELIEQGFVEEVVEIPKPRWKVGDYVVSRHWVYIKIDSIFGKLNPVYNWTYIQNELRDPTSEELSTYFR